MRYFQEIEKMCIDEMDKFGLIKKGWVFRWQIEKSACGTCYYNEKELALGVSCVYLSSKRKTLLTIRHEIAHVLTPRSRHGITWRLMCLYVKCYPSKYCNHWDGGLTTDEAKVIANDNKLDYIGNPVSNLTYSPVANWHGYEGTN